MLAFAGTVLGIALLLGGGALLVRGASEVAAGLGISPMIIGLTIVGFGTSSPELVVNVIGTTSGETDIAFGNVVGSNISNLGLVLGAAALVRPIAIQSEVVLRELPLLLLATTMMTIMALDGPLEGTAAVIGRTDATILMLVFFIFVYITLLQLVRAKQKDRLLIELEEHPGIVAPPRGRLRWLLVLAGCALLFVGGEVTVSNGVVLANQAGVPTAIVGLFVVAIGTSMPELVTSIIAALRDESDLALGNVIGSNIFNSLMVLPVSGAIGQIPVPRGGLGDLIFSWLLAAALVPLFFFGRARLGRPVGLAFVVVYVAYAIARVYGAQG